MPPTTPTSSCSTPATRTTGWRRWARRARPPRRARPGCCRRSPPPTSTSTPTRAISSSPARSCRRCAPARSNYAYFTVKEAVAPLAADTAAQDVTLVTVDTANPFKRQDVAVTLAMGDHLPRVPDRPVPAARQAGGPGEQPLRFLPGAGRRRSPGGAAGRGRGGVPGRVRLRQPGGGGGRCGREHPDQLRHRERGSDGERHGGGAHRQDELPRERAPDRPDHLLSQQLPAVQLHQCRPPEHPPGQHPGAADRDGRPLPGAGFVEPRQHRGR